MRIGTLVAAMLLAGCAAPAGQGSSSTAGTPAPPAATTTTAATEGPSAPAATDGPSAPASAAGSPEALIGAIGNLGVTDQTGDGTRLRLAAEIDGSDGWVVVQADRGGRPGRVLGLVHRADGTHDDVVVVRLRPRVATGRLWVTLHLDRGKPDVYESPGPDTPLQFAGADLSRAVTLTVTPGG